MGMQCCGRVAGGHPEGQPLEGQKLRQNWFHVCGVLGFAAQLSDPGIDGSGGSLRSAETFAVGHKNTQTNTHQLLGPLVPVIVEQLSLWKLDQEILPKRYNSEIGCCSLNGEGWISKRVDRSFRVWRKADKGWGGGKLDYLRSLSHTGEASDIIPLNLLIISIDLNLRSTSVYMAWLNKKNKGFVVWNDLQAKPTQKN